jgi:hypothetical protein
MTVSKKEKKKERETGSKKKGRKSNKKQERNLIFEVVNLMSVKNVVFWHVAACDLADRYQGFYCCFHLCILT